MCQSQDQYPRPTSGPAEVEQPAERRLTEQQINFAKVVGSLLAARWAEAHSRANDQSNRR